MKKQLLNELLHDLEQELLRLGYTKGSMQFYRHQWNELIHFSKDKGEKYYSESLGLAFVKEHYKIIEKDYNRGLLRSEVQKLRIVRMIGDFQLHRTVLRRYYKHKQILTKPNYVAISNRFKLYCEAKNYSVAGSSNLSRRVKSNH